MEKELKDTVNNLLVETVTTVKQVMVDYGPDVAELTLAVFRIEAIQNLVYGFLSLLIFFLIIKYPVIKGFERYKENPDEYDSADYLVLPLVSAGISITFFYLSIKYLFGIVNWIGAFGDVRVYIAYKLISG